jgi:hypothetical protein
MVRAQAVLSLLPPVGTVLFLFGAVSGAPAWQNTQDSMRSHGCSSSRSSMDSSLAQQQCRNTADVQLLAMLCRAAVVGDVMQVPAKMRLRLSARMLSWATVKW